MRIYREKGKQLNIISKHMVVNIWKFLNKISNRADINRKEG